jgi:signal transduction histidine kinase
MNRHLRTLANILRLRHPVGQPNHASLRSQLRNGLIVIAVSGMLLLGLGITAFVYRTEADSWRDRENEAAASAARTVDLFLANIHNNLGLLSALDPAYLRDNPRSAQVLLDQTPALLEIVRLDPAGQVITDAYQDEPLIANLFTLPQSNWFQAAKAGRAYQGDVQYASNDQPYLILAFPASDGGVIAARLQMHLLWEVVSEIHFGQTGQSYVINTRGEVVAHADSRVILNRTSIAHLPQFAKISQAKDNRWHGQLRSLSDKLSVGSSHAIPNTDWIIITEISQAEAFQTTRSALIILGSALVVGGFILFHFTLSLMYSLFVTRIQTLRAGAQQIGQGDLGHRIPVNRQDELGEVAEAFNEMAGQLASREQALETARDEALSASQFKSRLLANVGHDLRTPIGSVLGYAEILGENIYGELNDQQRKANERILSNARRLMHLINSLLDQAQIEAGKLVLRIEEFHPAALLTAVHDAMDIPARTKSIDLLTTCDPALPETMLGDQPRIVQIITNLVENGLKFTEKGSVSVHLCLVDSQHWSIMVKDTGQGIPPEAHQQIFEAFQQLDSSTTRQKRGIGLGLSIVQQLTAMMGGQVQLASQVGVGSTFTILLPLHRSHPHD